MAETETAQPTAGAMRAAEAVFDPGTAIYVNEVPMGLVEMARTIDAETGLPELLEACQHIGCLGKHTCCEETPCLVCIALYKAEDGIDLLADTPAAIAKAKRTD